MRRRAMKRLPSPRNCQRSFSDLTELVGAAQLDLGQAASGVAGREQPRERCADDLRMAVPEDLLAPEFHSVMRPSGPIENIA